MMVAGMLTALMAVSAFAVDLGWLYLNTSRLQKAADADALAGVVNLPASPTGADTDAQMASAANKFVIGSPAYNTFASQVLPENQYEVTLGTQVQCSFSEWSVSPTSTSAGPQRPDMSSRCPWEARPIVSALAILPLWATIGGRETAPRRPRSTSHNYLQNF